MEVLFKNCSDAIRHATEEKSFGVFHSSSASGNLNIHTHECCELMLCIKGGRNFLIDNKVYDVNPGDLFVINQFEPHKLTLCGNDCDDRYIMQLHPEFLFSLSTESTDLSACFYADRDKISNKTLLTPEETQAAIELFEEFKKDTGYGDDIYKSTIAAKLLILVNKAFFEHDDAIHSFTPSIPIKRAIVYINEHFGDNITLDDVAKYSYISVNQLCKIFKSTLGTTVMKYIIGKRIAEAKKLLKAGNNVSDTALMCGFRDYSNFIRTFTASVGISPGKYSKNI